MKIENKSANSKSSKQYLSFC